MAAKMKNPAKRCSADGAEIAESLQGNYPMSLPSSGNIEQAIPVEPNYIRHDAPGMFEEATHRAVLNDPGAVCAKPFMDFLETTSAVAYGVTTILSMAAHADLERMAHESGSETSPFLNEYDKDLLLSMAKASVEMITREAERLAKWGNERAKGTSHV